MKVDIYNTDKKYQIIYADPPWQQRKGNTRKCRPNQGKKLDYETLTLEEIQSILCEVSLLKTTRKHNFFVWTIDKYLHETEAIMKELDYVLHARIIWDKENGVAPAFTVRFSHEYLLWFYKKGKMLMPEESQQGKYTTVLREKSTKHSKKPICAYKLLENLFPNATKLELFARNTRDGWDCWGDEAPESEV